MFKKLLNSNKSSLIFIIGLVIFTGLNVFSASTMELHFDEAYYWIWSQKPAFGYFDHPPMVAWLIMIGQWLLEDEIGVRLLTIIMSSMSITILWRMARRYSPNAFLFWMLTYSICLIHPYSFIATPDAPLFFFSTLFFYFYRRYLEKNNFQNAVILAFIIALMIYSKYHAFLLIGLVVLFNLKLLKRFSFWFIVFHTLIYLAPHILWQIDNDFPSFRYHLFERHVIGYNPLTTLNYIFSEIALAGPMLGWLFLYVLFTTKITNDWERALKFSGAGVYLFFLVSTFSGNFEAHWTLIALIPLLLLSYKYVVENQKWQKWIVIAGSINFVLLLAARIIILTPFAGNIHVLKQFSGNKENMQLIDKVSDHKPVIFQDTWTDATLYSFNKGSITTNLNSGFYRRNQFDIYELDESFRNQSVYVITTDSAQFSNAERMVTNRHVLYGKTIDHFNSYYNVTMTLKKSVLSDGVLNVEVALHNPYDEKILLGESSGYPVALQLYYHNGKRWVRYAEKSIDTLELLPDNTVNISAGLPLKTPVPTGKNSYLMLKIGELNPISSRCLIEIGQGE
jgi:hypothetical protein